MSTVAGIDIGGDALKGVVLRRSKKGATEIVSAGALPLGDLSFMEDSDDKTLAIGEKLKELVKSARLKAPQRRVGVSGSNTSIRYIQVPPVPPWRLEMLVKYDVEERANEKEGNAFDFRILDVPETGGQYTVMIGMCRETAANELLAVGKSSGLGEVEIDLEALALYNAYYHGHGFDSDKTVVVLDVGANDITILICRNGSLYFARTMLGGGQRFTHALAEDLKIEQAEAEQLKKAHGEITFDVSPVAGRTNARIPRPGATNVGMRPNATGIMQRLAKPENGGEAAGDSGSAKKPGDVSKFTATKPAAPKPGASTSSIPNISLTPAAISLTPAPISLSGPAPAAPAGGSSSSLGLEDEFSSLAGLDREAAAQPEAQAAVAEAPRTEAPAPRQGPVMMPSKMPDSLELELPEEPQAEEQPVAPKPAPRAPVGMTPAKSGTPPVAALMLDLDGGSETSHASKPAEPEAKTESFESAPTVAETSSDEFGAAPKSEEPKPEMDEKRKRQVSSALVREAASLCAALENALTFARQQTKIRELKADRVYITGGGSKLKGLPEFMSRRLRMEVVPLEPLKMLSLDRLDPAQAEALKAEQHTMAVAIGLGIGELQKGTFSFLLWPQMVKDRKVFWSRGAYVYYAAASLAAAVGLTLFTPYNNASALQANTVVANEANSKAKQLDAELHGLITKNEEKRAQLKQISENTSSGHFFLNLLGELKSKLRITDDIYLTSLTTSMPQVILTAHDEGGNSTTPRPPSKADTRSAKNVEPDTFQAQRRVYLRGFVRSHNRDDLIDKLRNFYEKRLVPHPLDPDNAANLFKDIRPVWISPGDTENEGFFLKEFVLEAWTDGTREVKNEKAPVAPTKGGPKAGAKAVPPNGKTTAQPEAVPVQPEMKAPAPKQPAVQPNVAPPTKVAPPARVQPVEAVPAQPVAPQTKVDPAQPKPAVPAPANPPGKKFVLPAE